MTIAKTVYVIDDDDAVRDSLATMLGIAGFEAEAFESAVAFLDTTPLPTHGCVVSDVRMPGCTGLQLLNQLKAVGSHLPVVLITGHGDIPLAVEAMRAGAADFIEKPFDRHTIVEAIQRALDPGPAGSASAVNDRLDALTQREREVLEGLTAGKANKVIARDLGISPRTVEVHRANLMLKMNAASFSDLVRMSVLASLQP